MPDLNPTSKPTQDALNRFAPIYAEDYDGYKQDFLKWLRENGNNPFKGDGLAEETIKTTHYKIEQIYRWKWRQAGAFTKDFTPDDAEAYVDHLVRETDLEDREVRDHIKAIKRLFKWFDDTSRPSYDWEYSKIDQLKQKMASKRQHYLKTEEMLSLYDAAIEYGSVRSYRTVSPKERGRMKAYLADRFGNPRKDIGPADFRDANSWKFPSLISMSIDLGLRPIEVKRSQLEWLRLQDSEVIIPRNESSKSEDPWDCALSDRSVRALQRWIKERNCYEKYDETGAIWLTKYGNPYDAYSLRTLFNNLLEMTDIKPRNRDLTWYSIRRGSATMWVEAENLGEAATQLRHKKLETTRRYRKSSTTKRQATADELL